MKIYKSIDEFNSDALHVLTTGTFDGVHHGHKVIINRLKEIAKNCGGETVLLTFHPHPRSVIFPNTELDLLTSNEERMRLLEKEGLQHLIIHPFTRKFSRTTAVEYVRDLLVNKIKTKKLIIGYDHQFGRNRQGSLEELKLFSRTYDFEVEEIPAQEIDAVKVSSTKIRKALLNGDLASANHFLGYHYSLNGIVVNGEKIGRTIDFPTANVEVGDKLKLIPKSGVYAVEVISDGIRHSGMCNIGVRPTVANNEAQSIEVHIFDFDKDIYQKNISIFFIERIRDEKRFESVELLKNQLNEDADTCKKILLHASS